MARHQFSTYPHTCSECGVDFLGKPTALTCSPVCQSKRRAMKIAEWKRDHPEHSKRYYDKNPTRQVVANRVWCAKNPTRVRATKRRSYAKNVDKCRARTAAYFAANPGLATFHRDRMRARIRKAKAIFDTLVAINPKVYGAIADVRDKGRATIRALKTMGIEVVA